MLIEHNGLRIRNATVEDAKILCNWWNDGRIMAHAGYPNGLSTTEEKIIFQLSTGSDETYRRLIVEINHIPIGEMSYRVIDNKKVEIGIKICDESYQNQGHGSKLLCMLISELFKKYEKIVLDTNINNARARHTYKKLGFVQTKVNIDSSKDQLGNYQTSVDYELSADNFTPLIMVLDW